MRTKFNDSSEKILACFLLTLFLGWAPIAYGQSIWAHNDYLKKSPFQHAYELGVEYIEADVFLEKGALVVAHTRKEIDPAKTLEEMYLNPLSRVGLRDINLAIDFKTGGAETMAALIKLLEKYPALISSSQVHFVLSGDYPAPSEWKNYPAYIWFDGRPNVDYTPDQLKRIRLISTSFASVSNWKGVGEIPDSDLTKIRQVIDRAHNLEKPVRFWAIPDTQNSWEKLKAVGVSVINTDNIDEVSKFIRAPR